MSKGTVSIKRQMLQIKCRNAVVGDMAFGLVHRSSLMRKAKYQLERVVRVHLGADDSAYKCAHHP